MRFVAVASQSAPTPRTYRSALNGVFSTVSCGAAGFVASSANRYVPAVGNVTAMLPLPGLVQASVSGWPIVTGVSDPQSVPDVQSASAILKPTLSGPAGALSTTRYTLLAGSCGMRVVAVAPQSSLMPRT